MAAAGVFGRGAVEHNTSAQPVYHGYRVSGPVDLLGHARKVHSVAWSRDGNRLASGSVDRTVRLWALDRHGNGKELCELRGHTESVDQLCWSPTDMDLVATASGDKTVRIWDAKSAKQTQAIPTIGENINIAWNPDGNYIAVGNKDDDVSLIDVRKGKVIRKTTFKYEVNEFSWDYSGKYFFITTGQNNGKGTVEIMRFAKEGSEHVHTISAHPASCYCMDFAPTGRYLAVGSADALVSIWDLEDLVCVRTMPRLTWPVRTLSFSHDGQFLASASEDLQMDIADVETGERAFTIETRAPMNSVAWHPNKHVLAYAGDERIMERGREREGIVRLISLVRDPDADPSA